MAQLNSNQVITITRAAVLLGGFGHVLSDHDQQLVADVGLRFRKLGRDAHVTDNEWPVIEEAVGAMAAAKADAPEQVRLDTGARDTLAAMREAGFARRPS